MEGAAEETTVVYAVPVRQVALSHATTLKRPTDVTVMGFPVFDPPSPDHL